MSSGAGNESSRSTQKRSLNKSDQLESTLKELESAFADWDAVGSPATPSALAAEEARRKAAAGSTADDEMRKRTRKLLNQLREQLEKLND